MRALYGSVILLPARELRVHVLQFSKNTFLGFLILAQFGVHETPSEGNHLRLKAGMLCKIIPSEDPSSWKPMISPLEKKLICVASAMPTGS